MGCVGVSGDSEMNSHTHTLAHAHAHTHKVVQLPGSYEYDITRQMGLCGHSEMTRLR